MSPSFFIANSSKYFFNEKKNYFCFIFVVRYLPLIDVDDEDNFDWFWIGDAERTFPFSDDSEFELLRSYDDTDDNESSNKFFVCFSSLFVLELDNGTGGVENKSSKSTDCSVCDGSGGDFDGISRKRINGSWTCSLFDNNRDDDEEEISSRSCSCSDTDGVDIDDAIDDERFSCLDESR